MRAWLVLIAAGAAALIPGCATQDRVDGVDLAAAVEQYRSERTAAVRPQAFPIAFASHERPHGPFTTPAIAFAHEPPISDGNGSIDTATPPAAEYWRQDLWHQMGREALNFGSRDLWRGFRTSFWDLENALILTAALGASVTVRETGVDDTIRNRTHGSRALGDFDEPLQLLAHPGVHFAGAGVLWLTSTLTRDQQQHEVAKALGQALAVNGITTMALKAAVNTRAPDGEGLAWPSGHTSSIFTVAAVLNEYYGPLVGLPSFALAGLAGYQRLDSRVHDFSDVIFGAALGYVVGTSIARDQKAAFPELFGMQLVPFADPETGTTGFALLKQW